MQTATSTILETLATGMDLAPELAEAGFSRLMDGEMTCAQAGSFLMGLRMKGETPQELTEAVRAALARAVRVTGIDGPTIDIVGTGGDGRSSFNCSTATALTLAGMGHRVVKHGNRAVSSSCGAADAVEGLGLPLELDPEDVRRLVAQRNFVFLFAPRFHPAFRNVMPIRRELGVRTLFNLLGPLLNPARPNHMLLGVARAELLPLMAQTLLMTGVRRAAVVHGAGGYDELTPMGPARIMLLEGDGEGRGTLTEISVDPADYGIAPCTPEELAVPDRDTAVRVLRELLSGGGPAPMRDMLVLNVGMALHLLEPGLALPDAMAAARLALAAGAGGKVLHA
ncbi:anthranilate phosphoribosyltransferase [Desulfovibrio oxamicus]|uniref:Anthranilate phosphoribosyltransferase n=1 Tax=Nitratidesulfovibrio oxamicus TaxID=32016 RepID=A0ABS0J8Q8_9BACT|nr:anthranilate phosphoribosyltransferase [Nitratidesulfovibrio oxamicus]MBG3878842.1 anthranilate phosphoribosyltransferase [Nitratidesulfovibrio oxamicus]